VTFQNYIAPKLVEERLRPPQNYFQSAPIIGRNLQSPFASQVIVCMEGGRRPQG